MASNEEGAGASGAGSGSGLADSRRWSQALVRRVREPARVAGFIEPASNVHHIVMVPEVGFHFDARELGTGRTRGQEVGPGELCVAGAGSLPTELGWRSRGRARTFEVVELCLDPLALDEPDGSGRVSLDPNWRVLRDPLLGQLLRSIADELTHPASDQEIFGDLAIALFAAQLARAHGVGSRERKVHRGGLAPWALARVREYVAAHLRKPIRLQQLADLAGLSSFHFAHAFKASLGVAPHGYVLRCRVNEAKRLLAGSALPISEVARRSGFSSTAHFSTRFRAVTGVTPSRFRSLARP